jgi:hypothetical protein
MFRAPIESALLKCMELRLSNNGNVVLQRSEALNQEGGGSP